jgi:predicted short-subunit dehydrogenase-like oxidoreductase (DUF2520 family)
MIQSVNIIGTGNVASYLAYRLGGKISIRAVYSRTPDAKIDWAEALNLKMVYAVSDLPESDLTIICIKDDAIHDIAALLDASVSVVHTSGSIPMQVLSGHENHGILYPLQTISKERVSHLSGFPFLVEANQKTFESTLLNFATTHLSSQSVITTSESRARIHLAAVFANNFSNYFLIKAKEILDKPGVDFQLLKPLLQETIDKAFAIGPEKAQTGPAKRNDQAVIQKQAALIEDEALREIYLKLTALIAKQFNFG